VVKNLEQTNKKLKKTEIKIVRENSLVILGQQTRKTKENIEER